VIDIEAVRAVTPGCEHVLHFNNAGASLMPAPVIDAVHAHLELECRIGAYEAEATAAGVLRDFYVECAALVHGETDEIAYVENATRAWDFAFYSLELGPGDRVLTHAAEYASNYLALMQQARRRGFRIDVVPSDPYGQVDVVALDAMAGPDTRLIALTHVPTQGGLVNPVEEVGRVARRHGIPFLLDACQSAGQLDLDVSRIGCDMLSATGRKFLRGPRGTGFLYVKRELAERLEPAFIDMRAATWSAPDRYELAPGARRFETWESFVAGRIGLMHAVRYARSLGLEAIESRVTGLAARLREALAMQPGIELLDQGQRLCGIVSFRKIDEAPEDTRLRLLAGGINVSVTPKTSAQLDFASRGIDALVRASVHYYNTDEEIERFVRALVTTDAS
jgi:cysteine desulfurase / selenocysteine lyase